LVAVIENSQVKNIDQQSKCNPPPSSGVIVDRLLVGAGSAVRWGAVHVEKRVNMRVESLICPRIDVRVVVEHIQMAGVGVRIREIPKLKLMVQL
jgi:hypothetical protein